MFKKGDIVIAIVDIDGKVSKGTIGICTRDQYDTVYVEVKWDDFYQGWGAGKAYWNVENKDIKLYQELKEVVPEYVECVGAYGHCDEGIIYCTANEIEENSLPWQEILISCGNLGSYFIPSTKEAFDLQNQPKEDLVGRYIKALVNDPVSVGMSIGDYLLVTKFNTVSNNYRVTGVKDNKIGYNVRESDLPKFEVMPVGFNPTAKEQPINTMELTGDWCIKCTPENREFLKKDRKLEIEYYFNIDHYYGYYDGCPHWRNSEPFGKELTLDEFKRLVLKEDTNSEEFKVGDWIVVKPNVKYFSYVCKYIDSKSAYYQRKATGNFDYELWFDPNPVIRRATPEEIAKAQGYKVTESYINIDITPAQPSSSASMEEILAYCKLQYKEGDTIIPINSFGDSHGKEYKADGVLSIYPELGIGFSNTSGFVYAKGKYAEILSSPKQELKAKYPLVPEDCITFVKPKKEKYKFSEVEYLAKPINQQLNLPIVKKYKKKSIINL